MSIQALSQTQLEVETSGAVNLEYIGFIRSVRRGSGGRLNVGDEGRERSSICKDLVTAARIAGKHIVFLDTTVDKVVFQVV